jgi:DNA-directed RNA polymerase subunit RPC12/RpoP
MTPAQQMLSEEFADDFHANTSERQERLRRLAQQSPKNRIAAMTQRINDPSKCEYCGSRRIWTVVPSTRSCGHSSGHV